MRWYAKLLSGGTPYYQSTLCGTCARIARHRHAVVKREARNMEPARTMVDAFLRLAWGMIPPRYLFHGLRCQACSRRYEG